MNKNLNKVVVTGSAGFIGYSTSIKFRARYNVIGIDNHNNYYDPNLKEARLKDFKFSNYIHYRVDLVDKKILEDIFKSNTPQKVVNLAAQAGVRYSIKNPIEYIKSNILGFANILENCREYRIDHLVYASTSCIWC